MKNKSLDETVIKCPNCHKDCPGKHVNNPYEDQGICDWCALKMMLRDALLPSMTVEVGILDENGYTKLYEKQTRSAPPKPSEVN